MVNSYLNGFASHPRSFVLHEVDDQDSNLKGSNRTVISAWLLLIRSMVQTARGTQAFQPRNLHLSAVSHESKCSASSPRTEPEH